MPHASANHSRVLAAHERVRRAADIGLCALARADRMAAVAIFLLALSLRAYVATRWVSEPVWDAQFYHFGAVRIARGFGYSEDIVTATGMFRSPWCHFPVGYSGFLAGVYSIFGASVRAGTIAGSVVGALSAGLAHRIAFRAFGRTAALVAGLSCALCPALVLYGGVLMTEPLAALGLTATLYAAQRLQARPWLALLIPGVIIGLFTLVRPQMILTPVALAAGALAHTFPSTLARIRHVGLTLLIPLSLAVVVVLPWTVRNCRVMDGCVFVSSNGGWNLAVGSSPHATGRWKPVTGADGCRQVSGQVDQDRCWSQQASRWIKADPWRWIGLMPKKLSHTFDHQSFAVGYLAEPAPDAWPEERRARYRNVSSAAQALLWLLSLGAAMRIAFRRGKWFGAAASALIVIVTGAGALATPPTLWPAALAIAAVAALGSGPRAPAWHLVSAYVGYSILGVAAVHAVFFGEDRYQTVITPLLCVLSSALFAKRADARVDPSDQNPAAGTEVMS